MRDALCLLLLCPIALGCEPVEEPPPAVPGGPIAWSYIAVARQGDDARARGFDDAVPPGAAVEIVSDDAVVASVDADERGRFDLSFGARERVTVRVSSPTFTAPESLSYEVRDLNEARARAVRTRLAQTGAVPNDLLLPEAFATSDDALLVIVNSGDNTVDNISLSSGQRRNDPLQLADGAGPTGVGPAQPFSVAAAGDRAVVTRLGHSGITLFEISTGRVLDAVAVRTAVPLPEPFRPAVPVDADGDGAAEEVVGAVVPRTFEGIAVVAGQVVACAANLLQAGAAPIYAPGMVLQYRLTDVKLEPGAAPQLTTFLNPQVVTAAGPLAAVVETGVLALTGEGWQATTEGGVDLFDPESMELIASFSLGMSAPGSAVTSADGRSLYVGSLLSPEIYVIDLEARAISRGPGNPLRLFNDGEVQSVFSLVAHPMGIVFASSFNTDQVYAVDVAADAVSPWPFEAPFAVAEGGAAFAGAHAIALRPGKNGVDFRGPDLAVLMSLAARIATIDTRYIMGP